MLSGGMLAARRSLSFDKKASGVHCFVKLKCICGSGVVPKRSDRHCGLGAGLDSSVAG